MVQNQAALFMAYESRCICSEVQIHFADVRYEQTALPYSPHLICELWVFVFPLFLVFFLGHLLMQIPPLNAAFSEFWSVVGSVSCQKWIYCIINEILSIFDFIMHRQFALSVKSLFGFY